MKNIFVYFISIIFLYQNSLYASSVKQYFSIDSHICSKFTKYMSYAECLEKELTTNNKYKSSGDFRKNTSLLTNISFIYQDLKDENFLKEKEAFNYLNILFESNLEIQNLKFDLEKVVFNSKCLEKNIFKEFISCFNSEFRNFPLYRNNTLLNKFRFEEMIFNTLMQTKGSEIIFYDTNSERYDFKPEEGFKYFELMIEKISLNYFEDTHSTIFYDVEDPYLVVDKSEELRNILIFLVAALLISYIAKKAVVKIAGKISSSGSTASSSVTTSSSSSASAAASNPYGVNLSGFAPGNSILRRNFLFNRLLRSGRLTAYGF
jgi:hypothetical protein